MATAQTIIDRSIRLLGKLAANTTLGTAESADCLVALNAMQSSWNNDVGVCYATQEETLSMVTSQGSYTIGPGGDLSTIRPVKIENAYILSSNNSYYVDILSDDEYDAILSKTSTSDWPDRINYRATMPTGTLYVYPVPSGTAGTLYLRTRIVLAAFALTDTVSLPPGWEDALAYNLAVMMAPEYEMEPSPTVKQMAVSTKAAIKRINKRTVQAETYLNGLVGSTRHTNIYTDQP